MSSFNPQELIISRINHHKRIHVNNPSIQINQVTFLPGEVYAIITHNTWFIYGKALRPQAMSLRTAAQWISRTCIERYYVAMTLLVFWLSNPVLIGVYVMVHCVGVNKLDRLVNCPLFLLFLSRRKKRPLGGQYDPVHYTKLCVFS